MHAVAPIAILATVAGIHTADLTRPNKRTISLTTVAFILTYHSHAQPHLVNRFPQLPYETGRTCPEPETFSRKVQHSVDEVSNLANRTFPLPIPVSPLRYLHSHPLRT